MIFLLEILEPYISIHYVRDTIDTKYYVIINQKLFLVHYCKMDMYLCGCKQGIIWWKRYIKGTYTLCYIDTRCMCVCLSILFDEHT